MANLEQVEKLREKASVSFEEAKEALEASGDDILEAIIYLERKGRVVAPAGGYYNNAGGGAAGADSEGADGNGQGGETFGDIMKRFGKYLLCLLEKGNNNFLDAEKNGERVFTCPITAVVVLLVFFFWITLPLMVVGLFFGFRYRFRGEDLGKESVNRVMENASEKAEEIKQTFINMDQQKK